MSRRPTTIRTGPFGSSNPAAPQFTGRSLPAPETRTVRPSLRRQHFADRQMNAIQEASRRATGPATARPDSDGNLVPGVTFPPGTPVIIKHGLGRAWRGYAVQNVAGSFARFIRIANASAALDAVQIQIQADAACTADVWVY